MADDQTLIQDQEQKENEEVGEKGGQVTGETSDIDFDSDMGELEEDKEYED
jgi:hypothetical protein